MAHVLLKHGVSIASISMIVDSSYLSSHQFFIIFYFRLFISLNYYSLLLQIEQLSYGAIFDLLLIVPLTLLWALFPDVVALVLQVLGKTFLAVLLRLPYTRMLEKEADDIGLDLAAKVILLVDFGGKSLIKTNKAHTFPVKDEIR